MSLGSNVGTTTTIFSSFESFLEGWLVRQEHYLHDLLSAQQHCHDSCDEDLKDLTARLLAHYQQYYQEKSRAASHDVFQLFSPPWFTPFERAFLWIAGFKPGLALRLATKSVNDLTEDQSQKMNHLIDETKKEERALEDKLARIQESVAAPPMLELPRHLGGLRDGDIREVDTVFETLRSSMESVVINADSLRTRTAENLVEILNPVQNVKFLAAVTQLQLKIRMFGLQKEAERGNK